MKNRIKTPLAAATLALVAATPAHADITGTIDATITLDASCAVNGQQYDDGEAAADFGTLDFGTQNTLFRQVDGEVLNGGNGLEIQCSSGVAPVLSFRAGEHDGEGTGGGLRAMAHASAAGQYVSYNLYSDAGRTTVIPIGGTIALATTGALQTVNIYGRAFGDDGLVAGTYSDTITVVLEL